MNYCGRLGCEIRNQAWYPKRGTMATTTPELSVALEGVSTCFEPFLADHGVNGRWETPGSGAKTPGNRSLCVLASEMGTVYHLRSHSTWGAELESQNPDHHSQLNSVFRVIYKHREAPKTP